MALFLDTGNLLKRAASDIVSENPSPPYTLAVWVKCADFSNTNMAIFSNGDVGNPSFCPIISADVMRLFSGAYATNSNGFTAANNTWHHFAWTWASSGGAIQYFFDGADITNGSPTVTTGGSTSTHPGNAIGQLGFTSGFDLHGAFAELAVYSVVLGADEIAALAAGFAPLLVRPSSLLGYVPGHEKLVDRIVSPWTETGTITFTAHPPVIYPSPPIIGVGSGGGAPSGLSIPIAMRHYATLRGA